MTLDIEGIVDRTVGGDEPLSLALGLELLHFSLPSSDRKVTVFNPIIISKAAGKVAIEAT